MEIVKFIDEENEFHLTIKNIEQNYDRAIIDVTAFPIISFEGQKWLKENIKKGEWGVMAQGFRCQLDYNKPNVETKMALFISELHKMGCMISENLHEIQIRFENSKDAAAFRLRFGIRKE
jgi:hypothetical protein